MSSGTASNRTKMVKSRGMPRTRLAVMRNATTIQMPSMTRSTAAEANVSDRRMSFQWASR